jgi:hypothetical protein
MTNIVSTSWVCQGCGAALISTPPDDGLCPDCQRAAECSYAHSEAPIYMCPDAQATCAECGGPVCIRCGQRLTLIPVNGTSKIPATREESRDDR